MKNKRGFTLIELLAVIVVLAIVMVIATTTVLPYMSEAREDSFRIEASEVVKTANTAMGLYNLGQIKTNNDAASCINKTTKKACFTVDYLIDNNVYDADKGTFVGKVDITNYDSSTPTYTLYFKKGDEFILAGETYEDYNKNGTLKTEWNKETNESCSCS